MKNLDKPKIEEIISTRKQAHSLFIKKSKVYRLFVEMEQNTLPKELYIQNEQKTVAD